MNIQQRQFYYLLLEKSISFDIAIIDEKNQILQLMYELLYYA
ncbi:hypothetical protein [Dapis sp. BLCC M172]